MKRTATIVAFIALLAGGAEAQVRRRAAVLPQGPELVHRLAAMSAEERERALSSLPPVRRVNLEERIRAFQALPPAQQRAMQERAAKIGSLTPERQAEVRASLRDFNELAPERKVLLRREIRRTTGMPDDSREAYMNSDGFRSRFSAVERKIIDDVREITPDESGPKK